MGETLSWTLTARDRASDVLDKFGNKLEESADGISSWGDRLSSVAGAAGVAAGAALAVGFSGALNMEAANDKMAAQLGATEEESERLGAVAGQLYAGAYGQSLAEVNDALVVVMQNIDGMAEASDADLQKVTAQVMNVATAFEQDLGQTTAAVGQMIRTGLAKDAEEALDIITTGLQNGANKSDDLLDTFNEYGTQFRKLGLDGKTSLGLLSQGLDAGARDADVVADALKEFSIRGLEALETFDKKGRPALTDLGMAFQTLGMDGHKAQDKLAAGGAGAAKTLDQVLTRLSSVKDPALRAQTAVALFGTQAEDLGDALYALDPSKAVEGLGEVAGAAERMDKTLGGNAQTTLTQFQRKAEGLFIGVAAAVVEFGMANQEWLVPLTGIVMTIVGALKAWTIAQAALNVVMALNPIGLVVIGLAALVAGLVIAWKRSETFRNVVHAAMRGVAAAFTWTWDQIKDGFRWLKSNWPAVLGIITGPIGIAVTTIARKWDSIVATARRLPSRVGRAVHGMWDGISSGFRGALNTVIGGWNGLQFTIGGATVFGKKLPSFTLSTPNIPYLAQGGIVTRPTLAVIGEGRQDEAVIPLPPGGIDALGGKETHVHMHLHAGVIIGSSRQLRDLMAQAAGDARGSGVLIPAGASR